MQRKAWQWVLAVVITLASAVWQRMSGPTYPARGTVRLGEAEVKLKLLRTHGGVGDMPVRVAAADPAVTGVVAWRRYPTDDPWTTIEMRRQGDVLAADLPHQPPAGKLEYEVRLARGAESATFPARAAVTRFKGEVALWLLIPHVIAMFAAMLVSTAAGLRAVVPGGDPAPLSRLALGILAFGGFVLGPLVQQQAFGALWTGFPFGYDLTDNKTLIAGLVWLAAVLLLGNLRWRRLAVAAAAVATLVVFMIPHSVRGSQIDWSKVPAAGAAPPRAGS